ncbi:hypothetical protein LCGC14_1288840, partial [marine sediment metagenome]
MHLVLTYDGSNVRIYKNGSLSYSSSHTGTIAPNNANLKFGREEMYGDWFLGFLDEIRIYDSVGSAGWIATEYNNQDDPDSFYSVSSANRVFSPSFNDFKYFKEITIDSTKVNGTGSHVNFPVLINITDSDLNDTEVQPNGEDIAFTDFNTWLDHEIELFNQTYNNTHAHLVAWVRIPSLSTSEDTIIRMYYGNSTMEAQEYPRGVWGSNYRGVWHLKEDPADPAPQFQDSTLNNNNGTAVGLISPNQVDGKIDGSIEFDDLNNRCVNVSHHSSLQMSFDISLSAWVKTTDTDTDAEVIVAKWGDPILQRNYWLGKLNENDLVFFVNDTENVKVNLNLINDGDWHYIVGVADSSNNLLRLYIDGLERNNNYYTGTSKTGTSDLHIGRSPSVLWQEWNGIIDEVRVSNIARSDGWSATEYNNQNDPDSFYSIGINHPSNADDFKYYKEIVIDHTKIPGLGYYANFPVLINITDSDLHNVDDVQLDGDDIAFSKSNEWLDHEIELFDQTYDGTHAHLVAWVRIPKLSTSIDTIIRMYYGNPSMSSQENSTEVWDNNYMGVWHLSESSGLAQDSTSYGEAGAVSMVTQGMNGQIDGAYDFNLDEMVNVGDPSDGHLDFGTGSFTISYWLNVDQDTAAPQTPIWKGGEATDVTGYSLVTSTNGTLMKPVISDGVGNQVNNEFSISLDSWTHIVTVIDRNNDLIKSYKSGLQVDSDSISSVGSISNSYDLQFSHGTYDFDGLLDEVRISNIIRSADWIVTEYNNQYDPDNFYSVGSEQSINKTMYSQLQVNAIDLYGNSIPNVNISMNNDNYVNLFKSGIANANGSVVFTNITQLKYNFTVTMDSNISPIYTVTINETSKAILINETFQILTLTCNVSRNIFSIEDVDGVPLDSGWIIVGNNSVDLQNCTINASGKATFRWLNTTGYNYTVWYRDDNYNSGEEISLASGDILTQGSQIDLIVNLTTVNFTVWTKDGSQTVSGVKLLLNSTNPDGAVINLTTDSGGKATFRWVNSSWRGNYSLSLSFYEDLKSFNISGVSTNLKKYVNFSIKANISYDIRFEMTSSQVEEYTTEIVSLNPVDYIKVDWGSQLKLRGLFNVTKAEGAPDLLGPRYADLMSYQITNTLTDITVKSGTMPEEEGNVGRHYTYIDTDELESNAIYWVTISAYKSGFTIPSDLTLVLNILENELILNQSQNDDSVQTVYWLESVNMSVKPYGKISESFTSEDNIIKSVDHRFNFSIPDISTDWNLSQINFNIYN